MIFCNTKIKCEEITLTLQEHKLNAKFINSTLEQKEREDTIKHTIKMFRS